MKEKMRTASANVILYGGIPSPPNLLKELWVNLRKTTSALKIRCSKEKSDIKSNIMHLYGQDMTRLVSGNPVMILRSFLTTRGFKIQYTKQNIPQGEPGP